MLNILRIIGIISMLLVTGSAFAADEDYPVAKVGEEKIYFSEIEQVAGGLNRFLKENFETSKDWRLDFIRNYVARLALAKRAEREGIDKKKDVLFALEQVKRNILTDKLLGDRLAKIEIKEEDLKKYYAENKARYRIKEKIKISYIKLKKKQAAEKINAQLDQGKDFDKIVRKRKVKLDNWISQDTPPTPELAGIGSPQVITGLLALGAGDSSEVIEIKDQFYIFHIEEKEPAQDKPLAGIRKQVEFEYSKKLRDEAINKLIMETFAQEKVSIYEDEIIKRME